METPRPHVILFLGFALLLIAFGPAQAIGSEFVPLTDIMSSFTNYDINRDRINEITSLTPLFEEDYLPPDDYSPLILVIVEHRLLEPEDCSGEGCAALPDLRPSLWNYRNDLISDGYDPRFVVADVYDGAVHQDGRTLLAMRRFLQQVQASYPDLRGAVLVGSFPEAMVVRTYPWKKHANGDITIGGKTFTNTDYIRIWPEIVAMRSDIVLSDLDGNWEDVYQQNSTTLPSLMAVVKADEPGVPKCPEYNGLCVIDDAYEEDGATRQFEDFFFVDDGKFLTFPWYEGGVTKRYLYIMNSRDDEVGAVDGSKPNAIAYPEVMVSRINSRHIAVDPDPTYTGVYGKTLLDSTGTPQTITTYGPHWHRFFMHRNPVLERNLLIEYFERNRAYRMGINVVRRVNGVGHSFDPTSHVNSFDTAVYATESPIITKNASLLDFANWVKKPALVKLIEAHASAKGTSFGNQYSVSALDAAVGGTPFQWSWVKENPSDPTRTLLTPSLEREGGTAALPLFRSLWNNHAFAEQGGSFYVHSGCDANSPANAETLPYSAEGMTSLKHVHYGNFQNIESILFYANGLAVIGRAKVFNDYPSDVITPLQSFGGFGEIVRTYYAKERANGALDSVGQGIRRKKAYFWSVIGDWTLTLN